MRTAIHTPVRAILFDFDDTLFDHALTSRRALARLRSQGTMFRGVPLSNLWCRYLELLERSHVDVVSGKISVDDARTERFRSLAALSGRDLTREAATELAPTYRGFYHDLRRAVPWALPLLRHLRPRYRIVIVSNNRVAEQEEKLRFLGASALVDALVVSEGVGFAKPDPRIFRVALDRLAVSAEGSVMSGDSWTSDVEGAFPPGSDRSGSTASIGRTRTTAPAPRSRRSIRFGLLSPSNGP